MCDTMLDSCSGIQENLTLIARSDLNQVNVTMTHTSRLDVNCVRKVGSF